MKKHTALIIDDDILNIQILQLHLKTHFPLINKVIEATSVVSGLQAYQKNTPDILLLDINLGNDTIFSFLDAIGHIEGEVIFISSHSHFGIRAVNIGVASYLLKPLNIEALKKAIYKVIYRLEQKAQTQKGILPVPTPERKTFSKNIAIHGTKEIELIATENIEYLEANGKYTIIYTNDKKNKLSSKNIGAFENELNPKKFFRTHNKFIVNIDKIKKITKTANLSCELENNKSIPIAKRRQDSFYVFLNLK